MNKIIRIFLSMITIILSISLSGCIKRNSFVDGQYISTNEVGNEIIPKIKLELHQIDEEKYISSNGINVIQDISITRYKKYFSFELYLYINNINDYVKINLTDFKPVLGAPQIYDISPVKDEENYNISFISLMYNDTRILIVQNKVQYRYEIAIIESENEYEKKNS